MDESITEKAILTAVDELSDELIAFRRDLHAHPELGFAEHRTTTKIIERLFGFDDHASVEPSAELVRSLASIAAQIDEFEGGFLASPRRQAISATEGAAIRLLAGEEPHDLLELLAGTGDALLPLEVLWRLVGDDSVPEAVKKQAVAASKKAAETLTPSILANLRARDEADTSERVHFMINFVRECGDAEALRSSIEAGVASGEFSLEDVAARFVHFSYPIGVPHPQPSGAGFSGGEFTDLTGRPARSQDTTHDMSWNADSWKARREFAAIYIGEDGVTGEA